MGCHFLLRGIFPTQGSNLCHLHCRQILYRLSYGGSPSSDLNKIKVYFSIRYNSSWYNNSALCRQRGPSSFYLVTLLFLKFCSYLHISKSACNEKALISSFYSRGKNSKTVHNSFTYFSLARTQSHSHTNSKGRWKTVLCVFFFLGIYVPGYNYVTRKEE